MLNEAVVSSSNVSDVHFQFIDERLVTALRYIDNNFHNSPLQLRRVSASAGLSVWHFSRLFNACVGMGFREYVRNVRLRHACRLLESSNLSIKEIAAAVGYVHLSDFYHHFKQTFGASPLIERRRLRSAMLERQHGNATQ